MVRRKKQSVKPNAKFYVFIGIIAAAVVALVFFFTATNTAVVEQGEIRFETEVPVIVLRDEQVVYADNYGKANYLVQEGERVEADQPVAEVYKWGYQETVLNDLIDIQTKIEQYQENEVLRDVEDQQLKSVNDSIAQKAVEIKTIINTGTGDILLAERELKSLMTQKQQYLKETVPADQQLEEFYSKEAQLQERVDGWRDIKTAPETGMVSFYFDGNEAVLNGDNLQKITSADITDILNGTKLQQASAEQETQTALYRLVNNFKWYLLIETTGSVMEFTNDNVFTIAFADYPDKSYQGTVIGNIVEANEHIYVIEITEDIGGLLDTRRTDAKVYTEFAGLKVPESALKENDGVTGVYVVAGRDKTFVPVDVKIMKDGNAIIDPVDATSTLMANQHVEV